eukprot:1849091-Pyramimonas_sp.AAC.1
MPPRQEPAARARGGGASGGCGVADEGQPPGLAATARAPACAPAAAAGASPGCQRVVRGPPSRPRLGAAPAPYAADAPPRAR